MAFAAMPGLSKRLAGVGFAFVPGSRMRSLIEERGPLHDWPAFAASWDSLPVDEYMADRGRYRRRRHAVYSVSADGKVERQPHRAHFQSIEYNPLNGGIERWFEPVDERLGKGPSVRHILGCCAEIFGSVLPHTAWEVELHQFRIEAAGFGVAQPTPEGMHRDGVDYVLVLLVQRHNIDSGTTMIGSVGPVFDSAQAMLDSGAAELGDSDNVIHSLEDKFDDRFSLAEEPGKGFEGTFSPGEGSEEDFSGSFTLTDPFDAALVDDHRVFHGVTPVRAHDASKPGYRDVLVVTFTRMGA
jgi:hypothetical protein